MLKFLAIRQLFLRVAKKSVEHIFNLTATNIEETFPVRCARRQVETVTKRRRTRGKFENGVPGRGSVNRNDAMGRSLGRSVARVRASKAATLQHHVKCIGDTRRCEPAEPIRREN